MTQAKPTDFLSPAEAQLCFGMPQERLARVAARRTFVELKRAFMRAADQLEGEIGRRMQHRIRVATEADDLWRLRAALLASLPETDAALTCRIDLARQIDSVFEETQQ